MQKIKKYGLGIATLLFVYFIFKQRKNIKNSIMGLPLVTDKKAISEEEIINSLQVVKQNFGVDIARWVEKIYRGETAHFKSTQFLLTYSAGMLKFKNVYPYGWGNFKTFWALNPSFAPTGYAKIYVTREKKDFFYLAFPSLTAAMMTLAYYVQKNGPLRWNSTDKNEQQKYATLLNQIKNRYV
jgi:hypothetical protein